MLQQTQLSVGAFRVNGTLKRPGQLFDCDLNIAFGIDRIAALMAGTESIRDVIPFPKTTGAQDLMTDAPSPIAAEQLAEVHVQVRPKQA